MNNADVFHEFNSLPDDLKKEVADFIAFLKQRVRNSKPDPGRRKPGTLKGKIKMAPDFDAPLDDFKEYMH